MFAKSHITAALAAASFSLMLAGPANATGLIAGATEPTQILNNIQLVASYAEQAQQTVTQFNQYQTMLKNLMQMTPSQLLDQSAQKLWADQNMAKSFRDLRRITVAGESTAYTLANIDQQFKNLNPGYNGFSKGFNFNAAYANWSGNTLNAVNGALRVLSAHADDFDTESDLMSELSSKSQTAQGQLQALQAGNQVGIAMVGQMQKLRQLQMAQMQAQNAFISGQQSRSDANDAKLQEFIKNAKSFKVDAYGKNKGIY